MFEPDEAMDVDPFALEEVYRRAPEGAMTGVSRAQRLVLAHFWSAFVVFFGALLLGEWQMIVRSPLHVWVDIPEHYYRSLTEHGTALAYVFPTLIAMGFGYAITELALQQALIGLRWAWVAFALVVAGSLCAVTAVASGAALGSGTFYPPLVGSPWYYIGIVLVVMGSWIWVVLMAVNLHAWRRANGGDPVPLAMYANVAGAFLWAWTAVGAALEILLQVLPFAPGFKHTIDADRARVLFSWTLHAIGYFWLMPTYIAFYVIVPRAIGGRLYSDSLARLSFALFLVFAMPIGLQHLFADPQADAGFKYVHSVFTAMVTIPALLTVFTLCASVEIAARLRGGKGLVGWLQALPWSNPAMLAVTFSFLILALGGAGGLADMSYPLDSTVHDTQWLTGHFELIFAGAVIIMYFVIAYDLWPHLTGRAQVHPSLIRLQLWLWFIGMLVMILPWHGADVPGMPRGIAPRGMAPRGIAYFDHSNPALAPQGLTVDPAVIGGGLVVASGALFMAFLAGAARGPRVAQRPYRFSEPVHAVVAVPRVLNGFAMWVSLMIALTAANYGMPIAHLLFAKTSVPAETNAMRVAPLLE